MGVARSMASKTSERELLLSAVPLLSDKVEGVVQQVRENFKASSDVNDFISIQSGADGIRRLYAVMASYAQCMEAVGVRTRVELEQFWARHYGNSEVREAVDTLLEEEDNFHQLVAEVEAKLRVLEEKVSTKAPASVGQLLPGDLELIESLSGQQITLETSWKRSKFTLYVCIRHFG